MDRRILTVVIDTFGGGPVGIDAVAAAVGEERDTIEDVYEPFLVREGSSRARRAGAWRCRRRTRTSAASGRAASRAASCDAGAAAGVAVRR